MATGGAANKSRNLSSSCSRRLVSRSVIDAGCKYTRLFLPTVYLLVA